MKKVAILFKETRGHDHRTGIVRGVMRFAMTSTPLRVHCVPRDSAAMQDPESWDADGIIAEVTSSDLADTLERLGKPIVDISGSREAPGRPQVVPDNVQVGRLAAEHFLGRGFRHLAYVGDSRRADAGHRGRGFAQVLRKHGLGFDFIDHAAVKEKVSHNLWEPAAEYVDWVKGLTRPLAIFAYNDLAALYVADACDAAGLFVPQEIVVLGVNNDESVCRMRLIPLSSIDVAFEKIGFEAAALLHRLMAGRSGRASPVRIPPVGVVTRQSSDIFAVDDPHLATALRFISDHLDQPTLVRDILRVVPLTRRELERRFQAGVRHTPLAEIHYRHVDRAKVLLSTTNLSVSLVAKAAGFGTTRQFMTVFKRHVGLTPSAYRKQ
jgi:LacI family transcriptional regulator, galactose operon repressor